LIKAGQVRVNGAAERDAEKRVNLRRDRIEVDSQTVRAAARVYLMLNKPRGLVTTASDEQGRDTVFRCLDGHGLPFIAPVGRLDQASEGLLLFTNDTAWAAGITEPANGIDKTYHVQVDCVADGRLIGRMLEGVTADGELLTAKSVRLLRRGERNSWLEVVLEEGKNRHLRRLLAALGMEVLRLVRVAIGPLPLGALAKGKFRRLAADEVKRLSKPRLAR
jgi:23S rRNA pseudouridine2605 synthase